jgi:hypothetical protein
MIEASRLEFPEVIGKSLSGVAVHPDTPEGSEVLLSFTDGTQLSINLGVRHAVDARYSADDTPDQPIFERGC